MSLPEVRRVSAWELRRVFRESGYESLIASKRFEAELEVDNHPSPERSKQPLCTRSQIVAYRDSSGAILVRVHMYLRRDGTIGASGKPDPKYLLYQGVIYKQA
jgi:hypothetical protein